MQQSQQIIILQYFHKENACFRWKNVNLLKRLKLSQLWIYVICFTKYLCLCCLLCSFINEFRALGGWNQGLLKYVIAIKRVTMRKVGQKLSETLWRHLLTTPNNIISDQDDTLALKIWLHFRWEKTLQKLFDENANRTWLQRTPLQFPTKQKLLTLLS